MLPGRGINVSVLTDEVEIVCYKTSGTQVHFRYLSGGRQPLSRSVLALYHLLLGIRLLFNGFFAALE
jgi:hypothetical protein